MNIHHLELFYYVAKHGGVSAAARRIPYGVQQPAISAQIIQLENQLGTTLFHRRPFRLTRPGEELFRFIEPFFGGLDEMGRRLRGGAEMSLRIGAVETVQREYLPRLLRAMQQRFSGLNFSLVPAALPAIERCLLDQEIDLGIAPLLGKRAEGISQREVVRVPMTLLVPEQSPIRSAEELWKQDRIREPLVTGMQSDVICQLFQRELQRRKVEWFASIELASQQLIARYVAEGFGIGLVVMEPGVACPPGIRSYPLLDFAFIPYGCLWVGILSPLQKAFLEEADALAASLKLETCAPTAAKKTRGTKRK